MKLLIIVCRTSDELRQGILFHFSVTLNSVSHIFKFMRLSLTMVNMSDLLTVRVSITIIIRDEHQKNLE